MAANSYRFLEGKTAGVIVLDLFMPHVSGQELLARA
jgi:FixJ family two-component response regulator